MMYHDLMFRSCFHIFGGVMRIYVIVLSQGHLLEFALSVCFATAAECRALAEAAGEEAGYVEHQ